MTNTFYPQSLPIIIYFNDVKIVLAIFGVLYKKNPD